MPLKTPHWYVVLIVADWLICAKLELFYLRNSSINIHRLEKRQHHISDWYAPQYYFFSICTYVPNFGLPDTREAYWDGIQIQNRRALSLVNLNLNLPQYSYLFKAYSIRKAAPIICAEVRTETVKAKNGPKS